MAQNNKRTEAIARYLARQSGHSFVRDIRRKIARSRNANNTSTRPSLRDGTEAKVLETGRGSVEIVAAAHVFGQTLAYVHLE